MSGPNMTPVIEQDAEDLAALGIVPGAEILTVSGGVAFVYGELGYYHTDGTVRKAINSSLLASFCEVICIEAAGVASGSAGLFRVAPGLVTGLSGGTANAIGYVSPVAGAITTTPPTYGTATWNKPVGRWKTTTVFNFHPVASIEPVSQA